MSRIYKTKRWERTSQRKLARDPVCEGCEYRPARHVHHIKAVTAGGAMFDPANHMSLCIPCHNDATAAEKQGVRWIRPVHRGCDVDGFPLDPMAGGVQSLQPEVCGPVGLTNLELVGKG